MNASEDGASQGKPPDPVHKTSGAEDGRGTKEKILDAADRVQPPMVRSRRLKIYYCTQIGTKPIRIKLFVNSPKIA